MERHLHRLVIAMIVLGTALAGWLGWLFAGIALQPVPISGKKRGSSAGTAAANPAVWLSAMMLLGNWLLPSTPIRHGWWMPTRTSKLSLPMHRSHELRTPLAVIQGVTEVLLDDAGMPPQQHTRLADSSVVCKTWGSCWKPCWPARVNR